MDDFEGVFEKKICLFIWAKCHIKLNHVIYMEVHGTPMNTIASTKYLGDIVTADAKNDLNIQIRVAKGMGNITRVMNMLDKVTLGKHYFKTLLRESIF